MTGCHRAGPQNKGPDAQSLICLNPLKRWKVGFDGDLKSYDLRYTIAHEIGRAIGLDHPAADGQIMGCRYEEQFRDLLAGRCYCTAGVGPIRLLPHACRWLAGAVLLLDGAG
jgi:hypothetical protein